MGLSSAHGVPKPDEERLAFLDKAYEMGETFWDTGKFKFLCSLSPPRVPVPLGYMGLY
jgi:hypothetical protein